MKTKTFLILLMSNLLTVLISDLIYNSAENRNLEKLNLKIQSINDNIPDSMDVNYFYLDAKKDGSIELFASRKLKKFKSPVEATIFLEGINNILIKGVRSNESR